MAQKDYRAGHNDKKQKGTGAKKREKTEYQRERDAAKKRKRKGGNYEL